MKTSQQNIFSVIFSLFIMPGCCCAGWQVETIQSPHLFQLMGPRSMAGDSDGYQHIAYGWDHLYYASENADGWVVSTVDASPSTGSRTVLALDSEDHAHIVYFDQLNKRLKYAFQFGEGWYIQTLPSEGDDVSDIFSMTLDKDGAPWICYFDTTSDLLVVLWDNGGGNWESSHVALLTAYFYAASIAVDGYSARIAYASGNPNEYYLQFAYNESGSWNYLTVDPGPATGEYIDMDIDAAHFVHIAYRDETSSQLKYTSFVPGGWPGSIEQVDSAGNTGFFPSICLDENSNPYIGYLNVTANGIKIAHKQGVNWELETVSNNLPSGRYLSMTLDFAGKSSFSHFDVESKDLLFLEQKANQWTTRVIDRSGSVGLFNSMVLNDAGDPVIAYSDQITGGVFLTQFNLADWSVQSVYSSPDIQINPSVTLDSRGKAHLCFQLQSEQKLVYASQTSNGWTYEQVETPGNPGSENAIALDNLNHPHICYLDYSAPEFLYTYFNGNTWQTETVHDGIANQFCLILDDAGLPHITYMAKNQTLWYAHKTEAGWVEEQLDSNNPTGFTSSLALDSLKNPHVVYYDAGSSFLIYMFFDGSDWNTETVAQSWVTERSISMILDRQDIPRIVFGDSQSNEFRYAFRTDTGWQLEIVDYPVRVNQASLGIDALDRLCVSYNDDYSKDLKFARIRPEIWYDLNMPSTWFETGDVFGLNRSVINGSNQLASFDEYVILDVFGSYWFAPAWTEVPDFQLMSVNASDADVEKIFHFEWPEVEGDISGIRFWGGIVAPGTSDLIDYDMAEFGW